MGKRDYGPRGGHPRSQSIALTVIDPLGMSFADSPQKAGRGLDSLESWHLLRRGGHPGTDKRASLVWERDRIPNKDPDQGVHCGKKGDKWKPKSLFYDLRLKELKGGATSKGEHEPEAFFIPWAKPVASAHINAGGGKATVGTGGVEGKRKPILLKVSGLEHRKVGNPCEVPPRTRSI